MKMKRFGVFRLPRPARVESYKSPNKRSRSVLGGGWIAAVTTCPMSSVKAVEFLVSEVFLAAVLLIRICEAPAYFAEP